MAFEHFMSVSSTTQRTYLLTFSTVRHLYLIGYDLIVVMGTAVFKSSARCCLNISLCKISSDWRFSSIKYKYIRRHWSCRPPISFETHIFIGTSSLPSPILIGWIIILYDVFMCQFLPMEISVNNQFYLLNIAVLNSIYPDSVSIVLPATQLLPEFIGDA